MDTFAWVLIFTSAMLVRGVTKGRLLSDLPDDLAQMFTAIISGDTASLKAALAQTGTEVTKVHSDGSTGASTAPAGASAGKNGLLTGAELTKLSWCNIQLAPAAAAAFERLNAAYQTQFRSNITVTDGYRDLAGQKAAARKTWLAMPISQSATVGASVHGLGRAVDLGGGINKWGSKQRNWMVANAPSYGWKSPSWAQQNGSKPEAWHWEYS